MYTKYTYIYKQLELATFEIKTRRKINSDREGRLHNWKRSDTCTLSSLTFLLSSFFKIQFHGTENGTLGWSQRFNFNFIAFCIFPSWSLFHVCRMCAYSFVYRNHHYNLHSDFNLGKWVIPAFFPIGAVLSST